MHGSPPHNITSFVTATARHAISLSLHAMSLPKRRGWSRRSRSHHAACNADMPLSNGCTYPAPKGTSGPPKELASYVAVTESVLNHCSSSCRRRCSCRWCRLHRDTHTPAIGAEAHDGTRHCEIIARPPPLALPLAPPLAPPLASSLSQSSQCGGVYTCAWTEFGALRIPRPPRRGHMGATVIPVR